MCESPAPQGAVNSVYRSWQPGFSELRVCPILQMPGPDGGCLFWGAVRVRGACRCVAVAKPENERFSKRATMRRQQDVC